MRTVAICFVCFVSSATALSPVTRVVELLKGLAAKAEVEGKIEEDLYESFVCWGKSVVSQKTASNAAAAAKIDSLEQYVADLDAGRIELTGERAELEKEIAQLMKDIEEAKALREKEKADFEDAAAEMNQAIKALDSAIAVLDEATKDHKEGVLMAMHSSLHHGMQALAQNKQNLKRAVALGEKFLAKADATFLKRLLTAEVPKADWKKLNRKATFKMAYKGRSFKIQDTLKKMQATFSSNLADATQAEADAAANYEKLSTSKGEQLTAAQTALSKGEVENGAKGQTKQEAVDEVAALKQQVADDERFIQQTQKSLDEKKEAWKVRSQLRTGEIAAISKAVSILHSDDARDLFKKSFSSQEGFFFLQVKAQSSSAASVIREAALKSGDSRLLSLAKLVGAGPKAAFGPIIATIDKMIKTLNADEAEDLEIKEECEKNRMKDTREAALTSRSIDDMTDTMAKLTEEIAQIVKDIASMTEQIKKTTEELEVATELRKKEKAEWHQSDADDKAAVELVVQAKDVLANFYKENDLNFLQKAPTVEAGAAPPPPPATWEGGYGGKTEQSQGIISILEMIEEDIHADMGKAKTEEDDAQASYDKLKEDSEAEIKSLTKEIEKQDGDKGDKETDRVNVEGERGTKKEALDAVLHKMAEISPNCEYFAVNYKMRAANRQIEIDGLIKAKAILQGGQFSKDDSNREIKPGDAFLQRRHEGVLSA